MKLLLAAVATVFLLTACGSTDDITPSQPTETATETAPATPGTASSEALVLPPVAATIGDPVREGSFEFVVTGVDPPVATLNQPAYPDEVAFTAAAGEYVVVRVNVKNVGNTPQAFTVGGQYALTDGAAYINEVEPIFFADPPAPDNATDTLNPGEEARGIPLIFDVPPGTVFRQLELHGAVDSPGVGVRL